MSRSTKANKLSNSSSRCEYISEDFACSYSIPLGIRHTGHTEVGGKEVNSMFEFVKLFCLPQTPSRLPLMLLYTFYIDEVPEILCHGLRAIGN